MACNLPARNGFYQPVKFVSRQIDESGSSLALVRNGKDEPLVLGEDAMFSTRVDLAPASECAAGVCRLWSARSREEL